ncbi:copper chaperone PCu(A)C [Nocardiopsis sp. CNT312]|uniref:copper chaperone PCu(A)C n=1 Tax=Nocardiopsis sp. CNT312 TaxID=1137268 RepID=UPI000491525C|nr:copper chaperone PCu(A)C [Nocardiopsis sp. CNT312]
MRQYTIRSVAAASLLALAATACANSGGEDEAAPEDTASPAPAAEATAADGFEITDPWIKAATQDDGMTAVFGEVGNTSDAEANIVAAQVEAADMVELHEGYMEGSEMTMSEIEGGFVIPAGDVYTLEPGGNHIMLMELNRDLEAGEEITVTVEFADGSTADFTAPVRPYSGANEEYDGGEDHGDHGDHSDHDMEGMEGSESMDDTEEHGDH